MYQNQEQVTPRVILLMSSDDKVVPPVTNGVAYYTAMNKAGMFAEKDTTEVTEPLST